MQEDTPYLYILMRSDIDSLNPGKAMAQAAHASNDFVETAVKFISSSSSEQIKDDLTDMLREWKDHDGTQMTFGTTIVLDGIDGDVISSVANHCHHRSDKIWHETFSGMVIDPSYPVRDGKVIHHIPLLTCGWVFTRKNNPHWRAVSNEFDLRLHK